MRTLAAVVDPWVVERSGAARVAGEEEDREVEGREDLGAVQTGGMG